MEKEAEEFNKLLKTEKSPWRAAWDAKKLKIYYYHRSTKVTQWVQPDELVAIIKANETISDATETEDQETGQVATSTIEPIVPETTMTTTDIQEENDFFLRLQREEEEKKLFSLLDQKDSILASDAIEAAKKLVREYNIPPTTVFNKLTGNYHGYPHMCKLLADWTTYADYISLPTSTITKKPELTEEYMNEEADRKLVEGVSILTKRRFSKHLADDMLSKYQSNPEWLSILLKDPIMSQTFLELYKQFPESAFLKICAHEIQSTASSSTSR